MGKEKYETLLLKNRIQYIKNLKIERKSQHIGVLLIFNVGVLFYMDYCMHINNISIVISYKLFYILIFSLILIIGIIYDIIKREININIILYIQIFLYLNLIFLIYSLRYILYLHNASPYFSLINILDLIEVNHKISVNFAIYCAIEYCSRFGLTMMTEHDIVTICSTTTDFTQIEIKLQIKNHNLLRDFIKNQKAQEWSFQNVLKTIGGYTPNIFNFASILISYAHTPMICCNIVKVFAVILLREEFPEEIFEDYSGLFYFLYPEIASVSDVIDFNTGII